MWGELLIGLLGIGSSLLTWYLQKKKNQPVSDALAAANKANGELLAKYAKAVKRIATLEKLVIKLQKTAYENYDIDDLIALANLGVPEGADDPN